MFDEEQGFTINDLGRRLANIIRIGTIFKIDFFNAKARVKIGDLETDMELQGVVTNVANFGAFVDLGVHQDGLVHISMLSDRFVDNPHKIVKVGQIVNIKVVSVDIERKRIALTMKTIKQPSN